MSTSDIVASTKMNTDMHIRRSFEAGIVELYIAVKHSIRSLDVALVLFPALQHRLRTKVYYGKRCTTVDFGQTDKQGSDHQLGYS